MGFRSFFSNRQKAFERFWMRPVDSRVYALVRIAFALSALYNWQKLWPHRQALFSDRAMTDLGIVAASTKDTFFFSVFYHFHSPDAVTAVFLAAFLALVCLGAGVFTRTAAALAFVFHLSYSYRAFHVTHGWDVLLRVIALVLLFSPISRAWSVDHWRRNQRRSRRIGNVAQQVSTLSPAYGLVLLQLQLVVMYVTTAWQKLGDSFWRSGDMMGFYFMSMYSRFPSAFFAEHAWLSQLATYFTLFTEIALPVLLYHTRYRWLAFVLGFALHLGIGVMSPLWEFTFPTLTLYLAFLTGTDIARIERWVQRRSRGPSKSPRGGLKATQS